MIGVKATETNERMGSPPAACSAIFEVATVCDSGGQWPIVVPAGRDRRDCLLIPIRRAWISGTRFAIVLGACGQRQCHRSTLRAPW